MSKGKYPYVTTAVPQEELLDSNHRSEVYNEQIRNARIR